jgi:alkylated DNA repair protein (DNA oxidative demethylase)
MARAARQPDLFARKSEVPRREILAEGAVLLRGFALEREREIAAALEAVVAAAPFRHMVTPGGQTMSVAMTNCGALGWITDRRGYRYEKCDPLTGRPWPPMPRAFSLLAAQAAKAGGYARFVPDACLINHYEPGARLTLHQDRNENDFDAPIVSVSLGLPAKFLFGGLKRTDKVLRTMLEHGDVVVWGGVSRLAFHGVDTLKEGLHPLMGRRRVNLTFRKAA